MGIIERLSTLLKSNVNDLIDKAEDPEKIANQVIHDLQNALQEASQGVAAAIAEKSKLQASLTKAKEEVAKYAERATKAVELGDDELAKEALKRKADAARDVERYTTLLAEQTENVDKLKRMLADMESKIEEAKHRRDSLITRAKSAEANKKIAETLSSASNKNPMDALDRMEEKVRNTEAQAEAYSELKSDSLEDRFAALDAASTSSSSIDDELAKLKEEMAKSKE